MIFGGKNDKDEEIKKMAEQMQNLSEQIGKLQQELAAKSAEAASLRTEATQNSGSKTALSDAQAQIERLKGLITDLQVKVQQQAARAPSQAEGHASSAPAAKVLSAEEAPASAGALAVGSTAYVTRAGGLPLRLRSGPSLKESILDRLQPGTQMTLQEGPRQADGHAWWHIRTSDGRAGWVAGEDLRTQPD
jgi:hypothetical protein